MLADNGLIQSTVGWYDSSDRVIDYTISAQPESVRAYIKTINPGVEHAVPNPFHSFAHHAFQWPFVITETMLSPWRSFFPYTPWPVKPLQKDK